MRKGNDSEIVNRVRHEEETQSVLCSPATGIVELGNMSSEELTGSIKMVGPATK